MTIHLLSLRSHTSFRVQMHQIPKANTKRANIHSRCANVLREKIMILTFTSVDFIHSSAMFDFCEG